MSGGLEDATHSVPLFEGRESRRHQQVAYEDLRAAAASFAASPEAPSFDRVHTLVQFAGFPRSGHSVVGSLIDAHPDALVAHELDLLGLVQHGFEREELFASICRSSAEFEQHGRWWNGYCYQVTGACGGASDHPLLLGDKKADWAVRRFLDDPTLLDRLRAAVGNVRSAWVLVVRNPFDNVATLSLRKGRRYDRIRINARSAQDFTRRLERQQGDTVTATVLPDMVADYAVLCDGVERLRAQVEADDWFELRHEDLAAAPDRELERLFSFLGLAPSPRTRDAAAATIHREVNRTRHQVDWPREARTKVAELVAEHSFLKGYTFDD